MVQVISQEGLGEALGKQAGEGLSSGMKMLLKQHLSSMIKARQQAGPISALDVQKKLSTLVDKDTLAGLSIEEREGIAARANQLSGQIGADQAFIQAAKEGLGREEKEAQLLEAAPSEEKPPLSQYKGGLWDLLKGTAETRPVETALRKKPIEAIATLPRGILWAVEDVAQLGRPDILLSKAYRTAQKLRGKKELLPKGLMEASLYDKWREKVDKDLSEEEQSALDQLEFAWTIAAPELGRIIPKLPKGFGKKIGRRGVASGLTPEAFGTEVESTFKGLGGSIEGLEGAQASEVNKLNKAVSEVSHKAIKERAPTPKEKGRLELAKKTREFEAERLAKEPLEEHLKPRKMTKAEGEARRDLKVQKTNVQQLEKELPKLRETRDQLTSKSSKATLDKVIENKEAHLSSGKEKVTSLQHQVKGFKKEVDQTQILKSLDKHLEGLERISKDPKSIEAKEWKGKFDRDQKQITKLEDALKRGELPSPEFKDQYTKILNQYDKAYQNMTKELAEKLVKDPKNKELLRLKSNLETNKNINRAKSKLHDRKIYAREQARRPLIAQELKNMKQLTGQFERDIFRFQKEMGPTEQKIKSLWENFKKAPTEAKAEHLAREAKVPPEFIKETKVKAKNIGDKIVEALKKGKKDNWLKREIAKELGYYKNKTLPRLGKAALGGMIGTGIQEAFLAATGIKLPIGAVTFLTPGFGKIKFGAMLIGGIMKRIYKVAQIAYRKSEYENQPSHLKKGAYIRGLREKGVKGTEIKKIMGG